MSREEKINKMIEEIKIRRNDEQYKGGPFPIYHIEFDILNEEIERLNNIINEFENILKRDIKACNNKFENMIDRNYRRLILEEKLEQLQELKGVDKE